MPQVEVLALIDELQEGQSWDDLIPVTLTREQWNVNFTLLMSQIANVTEALSRCEQDARNGDFTAIMVMPHLHDTAHAITEIIKAMGAVVAPVQMSKVNAEAEALTELHRKQRK